MGVWSLSQLQGDTSGCGPASAGARTYSPYTGTRTMRYWWVRADDSMRSRMQLSACAAQREWVDGVRGRVKRVRATASQGL
jgi:hypothetical protein